MTRAENTTPENIAPADGQTVKQNWSVMDFTSIVISLAGAVFTILPWGVFQSRLAMVDILLMVTPAFILLAALMSFAGTVLRRKTDGTRNPALALTARLLVWATVIGLVGPIIIKFAMLLMN